MVVAVDEAGMHHPAACVDAPVRAPLLLEPPRRADVGDALIDHRDRAVGVDGALTVHGENVAVDDDEVAAPRLATADRLVRVGHHSVSDLSGLPIPGALPRDRSSP